MIHCHQYTHNGYLVSFANIKSGQVQISTKYLQFTTTAPNLTPWARYGNLFKVWSIFYISLCSTALYWTVLLRVQALLWRFACEHPSRINPSSQENGVTTLPEGDKIRSDFVDKRHTFSHSNISFFVWLSTILVYQIKSSIWSFQIFIYVSSFDKISMPIFFNFLICIYLMTTSSAMNGGCYLRTDWPSGIHPHKESSWSFSKFIATAKQTYTSVSLRPLHFLCLRNDNCHLLPDVARCLPRTFKCLVNRLHCICKYVYLTFMNDYHFDFIFSP